MLNYKLFAVFAIVLVSGIFYGGDAFAAAGTEFSTPTQTNAYASYNNGTNQVQVSWNFNTLPSDTTCFLKGDVRYNGDLNINNGGENYIPSFTPRFYSPITSNPVLIEAVNDLGVNQYVEEVSCSGETRIDIDTIMNHVQNTNNYQELQLFLTFYTPDSNGDFNTSGSNTNLRIDEVFVMYTPVQAWNTGAQDYGCGGQIGSTLYIDASGSNDSLIAHGNNGDNCNEYLYLENDEYVDIGMVASPVLNNGQISYGNHDQSPFTLLIQVVAQIAALVTSSSAGGDDDAQSKPTFAYDHNTGVKRVDAGLVINGTVFPVTHNFHTPFPMLHLQVGETQNFTATVFSPNPLMKMEFAFGIEEVGKLNEAEASIVIETNYAGEVLSSEIVRDTTPPVLNATSLESSISKVKCVSEDITEICYGVSIEFSFMEPPNGEVFGVQAIDNKLKNQILYFNDGITLEGDSQNPPVTIQITSEIKYNGLQTIQRIDKENDIWMTLDKSEPVLKYQQNDFGTFIPIEYRITESTSDEFRTNPDRLHSEFKELIIKEQNKAARYFDFQSCLKELPDSFSYDYPETDRMDKISDDIESEKKRALESLDEIYQDNEKTKTNH